MSGILHMRGVRKTRDVGPRARAVLQGVDLVVEPREIVLVEGPSGGGKTTLLSVAAGLLSPDAGEVSLAGTRIDALDARRRGRLRARSVGFVFQRANLLPGLTVLDNVVLAGAAAGMDRGVATAAARALLERLGIGEHAARRVDVLSGGEEHRVGVARALVHGPRIVFADEPTGQLDSASGRAVARALGEQASQEGVAVVIASHDSRLRPFADRRLWMEDGRLRPTGGPDA
ncbi:MAG: ABC transporter ATP-binding protein [Myxococcota bacterium]